MDFSFNGNNGIFQKSRKNRLNCNVIENPVTSGESLENPENEKRTFYTNF